MFGYLCCTWSEFYFVSLWICNDSFDSIFWFMMLLVRLEFEQLHLPWLGFTAIWTKERNKEAITSLIINSLDHSEDCSIKELHRNENHRVAKEIIKTWTTSWLGMKSGPCTSFHCELLLIIQCGDFLDFLIPCWIVKAMDELRLSQFDSMHIFPLRSWKCKGLTLVS